MKGFIKRRPKKLQTLVDGSQASQWPWRYTALPFVSASSLLLLYHHTPMLARIAPTHGKVVPSSTFSRF